MHFEWKAPGVNGLSIRPIFFKTWLLFVKFGELIQSKLKSIRNSAEFGFQVFFNPLSAVMALTGCDERWPLFLFWCHQLWPKLASYVLQFCKRRNFSNDTQIQVISSEEPELCTKKLKNLTEKLRANLPATTCGSSMVKFACLMTLSHNFFELEAIPVEGQSL